jgi:hypothetical protein
VTPDSSAAERDAPASPLATSQRVSGHTLHSEGAAFKFDGRFAYSDTGWGLGKCSCGVLSEMLPSRNARKRWHREHKAAVLAEKSS